MRSIPTLTINRLRQVLTYDPTTGTFIWNDFPGRRGVSVGAAAGAISRHGYRVIRIDKKLYYGHRLAFFWMAGRWADYIDHKDRDTLNNSWANLREATMSQNLMNAKRPVTNSSGYKGVWFDRDLKKYRTGVAGQHLPGTYDDPETAHEAYLAECERRFGEFKRGK